MQSATQMQPEPKPPPPAVPSQPVTKQGLVDKNAGWISILSAVIALASLMTQCRTENREATGLEQQKIATTVDHAINARPDLAKTSEVSVLKTEVVTSRVELGGKIDQLTGHISELRADLSKLEGSLDTLIRLSSKSAASLSPQAFGESLSDVAQLFHLADERGISIDPSSLAAYQLNLRGIGAKQSEFWLVASEVVARRSTLVSGSKVPARPARQLSSRIESNTVQGGLIVLDGAYVVGNIFRRCVIEYHGGNTFVRNNLFIDCVFVLSVPKEPPPDGQRLIRALVASDLARVQG